MRAFRGIPEKIEALALSISRIRFPYIALAPHSHTILGEFDETQSIKGLRAVQGLHSRTEPTATVLAFFPAEY